MSSSDDLQRQRRRDEAMERLRCRRLLEEHDNANDGSVTKLVSAEQVDRARRRGEALNRIDVRRQNEGLGDQQDVLYYRPTTNELTPYLLTEGRHRNVGSGFVLNNPVTLEPQTYSTIGPADTYRPITDTRTVRDMHRAALSQMHNPAQPSTDRYAGPASAVQKSVLGDNALANNILSYLRGGRKSRKGRKGRKSRKGKSKKSRRYKR
jgi:hypothetical protein